MSTSAREVHISPSQRRVDHRRRLKRCAILSAGNVLAVVLLSAGCAAPGVERDTVARRLPDERLPRHVMWLESLDLRTMEQGWGKPRAGLSVDGNALILNGHVYVHGVGTHAFSEMVIDLHDSARRFEAVVGVDDESGSVGSVVFVVVVDDKEVFRSEVLRGGDSPQIVLVELAGASEMILLVEDGGDNIHYDHADWAGAMLLLRPGVKTLPEAVTPQPGVAPQLSTELSRKPVIHAPRITGATPGRPFLFRVPATGEQPLRFSAQNLPPDLILNPKTGIITGSIEEEGTTDVTITVENHLGAITSTLTIVGGTHKLARTPPMGWNSWNVWGTAINDARVRTAADWMVESGLADHGFQYINIDDVWEGERDTDGRIQPNEKFPDMKALADYVHSKGLKLGIYSSPGPKTCAGCEGSYEHEQLDAETYAEWGIDLLKYDWCSYGNIAKDNSRAELRKPYDLMRAALDGCGRDIVYSLCQYGRGHVSQWGAEVGGNYWRTTGDITDTWGSMSSIGFGQAGLEDFAGPGHWNDPDMLVVGMLGWGDDLHATRLTKNEQVTHITLWSLLAAPLLIGCDLEQLDEFTLALLTNSEVLEVNQDPLGEQARRVTTCGQQEIWARQLADGTIAVGLFNRSRCEATVTVSWEDLKLEGPQPVRNLWLRADEGVVEDGYTATVSGHGAIMLKIG